MVGHALVGSESVTTNVTFIRVCLHCHVMLGTVVDSNMFSQILWRKEGMTTEMTLELGMH